MIAAPLPLTRDVVLIGGGHTHALVLRMWGMNPLPGARLTLIDPDPKATYSGMLPGHIAGHYERSELDIDLVRLASFAGARLILGAVDHIDPTAQVVHVPGRPPIGFDLASIDIGITSAMPALAGFAEHATPAKPLGLFASRWAGFLDQGGPARVAVIGAGVAGVELALAMAHALDANGRPGSVTIVEQNTALPAIGPRSRAILTRELDRKGITLLEQTVISRIEPSGLILADGSRIAADLVIGAAGARPHAWLGASGLDLHEGYLVIDPELRTSDPRILAVGDCAHMPWAPRPKAGVYAVRQAPVLFHNIRASVGGGKPVRYTPQQDYLKLVSLGDRRAVGDRFGATVTGGLIWRLKDRIDRKFMARFQSLPAMRQPSLPRQHTLGMAEALGEKPMCGGCGAKVGRGVLGAGLGSDRARPRDDVVPLPGDDAALLITGGIRQVLTTDHLRTFWGDWAVMTRIAAIHSLGDIWAMGARPQAATTSLILPRQSQSLQQRMLAEIMETAHRVMAEAGAAIVGGHTTLGDELTIGFTLTGLAQDRVVTLRGATPGDAILLTKPLGSGVLMAAAMAGQADGSCIAQALTWMTQSQAAASAVLAECATAMTDVTGFGLAGHLMNICQASQAAAVLDLLSIPLMDGALDLSAAGTRSTLFAENQSAAPHIALTPQSALLFDPQTSGGLMACVPADRADGLLTTLRSLGFPAARIGDIVAGIPGITLRPV